MLARKSRKHIIEKESVDIRFLRAAGYIRLSVNKDNKPSDSIENQKKLIQEYIDTNIDLQLHQLYVDDNASGKDFNRPSFNQMLDAIDNNEINCVVCKDLSRIGRNSIDVLYYIQILFPSKKVRFISINDQFETLDGITNLSLGGLSGNKIPLKALLDEHYSLDISKKVQATINEYIEEGKFVAPRAPYGYKKADNDCHKLVVDTEVAAIVQEIYSMAFGKNSINEIVRELNNRKILSPINYAISMGLKGNFNRGNELWNSRTVKDILTNRTYIGDLVQGKNKRIIEHTHDALIERNEFEAVQLLLQQKTGNKNTTNIPREDNIFRGKVICGCCGSKMQRRKGSGKDNWYFFTCISNNRLGKGHCTGMYIRESEISDAVLSEVEKFVASNEIMYRKRDELKANAIKCEQVIQNIRKASYKYYEDYVSGISDSKNYKLNQEKLKNAEEELDKNKQELSLLKEADEQFDLFKNAFQKNQQLDLLVDKYVDRITVYKNKCITVGFIQ